MMIIFLIIILIFLLWVLSECLWNGDIGEAILIAVLCIPLIAFVILKGESSEQQNITEVDCKEKGGIYIKIENQYKCARKIEFIVSEEK